MTTIKTRLGLSKSKFQTKRKKGLKKLFSGIRKKTLKSPKKTSKRNLDKKVSTSGPGSFAEMDKKSRSSISGMYKGAI